MNLAPPEFIGQEWGGQRGIDNFMKGFSLMAAINQRKNQTALALERLQNEARHHDQMYEIGINNERGRADRNAEMTEIYKARLAEKDQTDAYRQGRTIEQTNASNDMVDKIRKIDAPEHTQEYRDAVGDILLD